MWVAISRTRSRIHSSQTSNSPGYNLRRGRIFFVGRYDDFTLNITPDFGGSPDGNLSSQFLYEANLNYTGFKPVTATIGYFKPWFSLYDSQSSNDFLLMERPSIIEISRNVAAGDARATAGLKASTDQWFAAWAMTGSQLGTQSSSCSTVNNSARWDGWPGVLIMTKIGTSNWIFPVGTCSIRTSTPAAFRG